MNDNNSPKGCIIYFVVIAIIVGVIGLITQCSVNNNSDHSSRSSSSSSSSSSNYKDHDGDGEYGFSDYLKDEAPDLYNDIKDRYDSLTD